MHKVDFNFSPVASSLLLLAVASNLVLKEALSLWKYFCLLLLSEKEWWSLLTADVVELVRANSLWYDFSLNIAALVPKSLLSSLN